MKQVKALLIIDAQLIMFDPDNSVYRANDILEKLKVLVDRGRNADIPIFFVQHNGSPNDPDAPQSPGWYIHPSLQLGSRDTIIQKTTPNSFFGTTLRDQLDWKEIRHLIIAGMQTEYCVDTTCRQAFSFGYEVTLVSDAHSTYDSPVMSAVQIVAHHNHVLKEFADVTPLNSIELE